MTNPTRLLLYIIVVSTAGLWLFAGYEFEQQQAFIRETQAAVVMVQGQLATLRSEQSAEVARRKQAEQVLADLIRSTSQANQQAILAVLPKPEKPNGRGMIVVGATGQR